MDNNDFQDKASAGTDPEVYVRPDYDRKRRCGWPEVIYGEGKTAEQIAEIFRRLLAKNEPDQQGRRSPIFATRCSAEKYRQVAQQLPQLHYDETARIIYDHQPEHGIGLGKERYLARAIGPVQLRLMQEIKKAFDPKGILNPGKVCFPPEDGKIWRNSPRSPS